LNLQNLPTDRALSLLEVNYNLLLEAVQGLSPTLNSVSSLVGDTLVIPKRDASTKPSQEGELLFTGDSLWVAGTINGSLAWQAIILKFGDKGV
jgi:hypothetical protein